MYDIIPKRSDSIFILLIGMLFHSCDFFHPPEESSLPKPRTEPHWYDKFEQDWTNEDRQAYLESLGNTQDWASPEYPWNQEEYIKQGEASYTRMWQEHKREIENLNRRYRVIRTEYSIKTQQGKTGQDEIDIMSRLSDDYDAYMDFDDYDANIAPTGDPEVDDINSYESFVEGDAGEWEENEIWE